MHGQQNVKKSAHQESHLCQYDLWYMQFYVGDRVVCSVDGIKLTVLMMSTWLFETCRELE
jgi:hypothetical protein